MSPSGLGRLARLILGSAAELAHDDDQRLLEQAPLVEVFQERRETLVEHGQKLVLQPVEVLGVRIPAVAHRHLVEVDRDHRNAPLGQPAGEQHGLAEPMMTVPVAGARRLGFQGKSLVSPPPAEPVRETAWCRNSE